MSYAYIVNVRRDADDPKKRNYSSHAILIAPFTAPFLLMFAIFLFILRALLFFVFIVVFTVALVVFRKPFILEWLRKIALKIGEPLLKANTYLIRLVFNP
jgi:O-antigen ligase